MMPPSFRPRSPKAFNSWSTMLSNSLTLSGKSSGSLLRAAARCCGGKSPLVVADDAARWTAAVEEPCGGWWPSNVAAEEEAMSSKRDVAASSLEPSVVRWVPYGSWPVRRDPSFELIRG